MPGSLTIVTLWTAAWRNSNVDRTCPGEHLLADRPGVHYVITRKIGPAAVAGRPVVVIRSHYTDGGAFVGAEVIPPARHAPYLREQELGWAVGVPYAEWMAAHHDLLTRAA